VTFGTGVNLKMAVSRLTGWAADCGVKEDRLPQVSGAGAGRAAVGCRGNLENMRNA